ncbi:MarR family transcriptional regulator [Cyclobacterium sp. 1_MG-2023]|uniref:MarR family winged helix-turn-helix transcriptional regulator n=1 Tax=Cyclobacterium sp. 1_MG-2023 TaxID=3062681 RepID=UPI0026E3162F|nr:MarR family transcriptional regulator [Cyclobacterium sp. 1_MG-2023]MDO6437890.1 MarR family transcriptional regulator [Cyclobacterium sp. 1_MG-2023]
MPKKIEFKFKSPNESPGYLLANLTLLWQRKQKKTLDPLNLTHTQFVLLASLGWLSRENELVTQVDIANQGNADRMMVSKVLRTLESKKFIQRHAHPNDTRAKIIKLTEEGATVLQKALTEVEHADLDFFSVLGDELEFFNKNMRELMSKNQNTSH